MKIYKKAILPVDFKASGIACGIKRSKKLDLALFYSNRPARASCKFTTNAIQAAPIKINKLHLGHNKDYQAIIVNSGNANCFTGKVGLKDTREVSGALAKSLGLRKDTILTASTGIIGRRLAVSKIKKSLPQLITGLSQKGIDKAKRAILTTDKFTKEITVKFNIAKDTITICGIAKGAGMIAPNLATMLCFILTDANITQRALDKALTTCVDNSFNCITVDGCMSTNDSVFLLANGAARNKLIDLKRNFNLFTKVLNIVCLELAKMIIKDAEGATKFIQIEVKQARDFRQAKAIALGIANSNLFKTAAYGENPNFGRIVSAAGATGIKIKEKDLKIKVSPLDKREIRVELALGVGRAAATVFTSDLTPEYIKINAEYN